MSLTPIQFGTDGWRAVIARDYTFDNVARVAEATARWIEKTYGTDKPIVLGHDTRFLGRQFAETAARVFASHGIRVLFAETIATTPAISWAALEYGCSAGIAITASHNPPEYNGFKIKTHYAGPATPEMIAEVEAEVAGVTVVPDPPSFRALQDEGSIELRDINGAYIEMLRHRLDVAAIRDSGIRIAHDAMFGAGRGVIRRLLGEERVVELRSDWNPGFHGQAPEPIERNLRDLADAVVRHGCAAGLANDGDADRIGMYDERGIFVDSHQVLALLLKYLLEERGLRGDVVKTVSTTSMLEKMAARYGVTIHTTPIGFKYIGSKFIEGDVLIGGEESGGIAVKGHIPERDGIFIGLLAVEMMVKRGRSLSALVQELFDEFGPHYARRTDVRTTAEKKREILDRFREGQLETIAGMPVRRVDRLDGFKFYADEAWLLVRYSGTEPLLRLYSEAPTPELALTLLEDARRQLGV